MSQRILLISINTCRSPYPVFPLGLAHIAGALNGAGHQTLTFDMGIDNAQLEQTITDFSPEFIGVSIRNIDDIRIDNTIFFVPALDTLHTRIRRLTLAPIIIGGSAFSLFPEKLLELSGADYGITGEGELAIVSLLAALDVKGNCLARAALESIPGLVYRNEQGAIICVKQRPLPTERIPRAIRQESLIRFYADASSVFNVQTQRGCIHRCCYCTYPVIEGQQVRARPAQEVVGEMAEALEKGARYFFIVDSVFNSSAQRVFNFCEELIRQELDLSWGCFLRPQGLTKELMDIMARSGLRHIEFGSDSFSDTVLAAYKKSLTFDDIFLSNELARNAGIHQAHFLIIGGPAETEQTIKESFANSQRLRRTVHFPFVGMRIYPGTLLHQRAIDDGVIDETTDLLQPCFYISPLVKKERIDELLESFRLSAPNWIIGDPPPEMQKVIDWMRSKGIPGPLWEYLVR